MIENWIGVYMLFPAEDEYYGWKYRILRYYDVYDYPDDYNPEALRNQPKHFQETELWLEHEKGYKDILEGERVVRNVSTIGVSITIGKVTKLPQRYR